MNYVSIIINMESVKDYKKSYYKHAVKFCTLEDFVEEGIDTFDSE